MDLQQLIEKIKLKRDKQAANQLIHHFYREIYAYFYRQVLDENLALDLTQEVFIKVLQSINQYDEEKASFRTYLYRIAYHHSINYFKSGLYQHRASNIECDEVLIDETMTIEEQVLRNEQSERFKAFIAQLPAVQEEVIRYRFYTELSIKEIAAIQEVSESTVKSRLYQSLNKLKKILEEEDYDYEQ